MPHETVQGRRSVKRLAVVFVVALAPVAVGCGADTAARGGGEAAELTQDSASFAAQADAAALALMQTLVGQLTSALAEGGPAHAIAFCATAALPLTDSVASAHGVAMQRVTDRTRNPANAADADDRAVMAAFAGTLQAAGSLPQYHVRRSADGEWRYYRPLLVGALCVQCHGPEDRLTPEVVRVLREQYPRDEATGYAEGELRGVLRVMALPAR
jgi:hypothetical protein